MCELLKQQRAYVKGRITYFWNSVKKGDLTPHQLTAIDGHIKLLYGKFDVLQDKIEAADPTEFEKNDRETFENNYCNLEALLLEKLSLADARGEDLEKIKVNVTKCRLPEIELPKFDGKYSSWITFRDEFESLVHSNETIDAIDKFRYLVSSLRDGQAFSVIEFIPRTALNYPVAWNRLIETFDNETVIKKKYIKDIYNISNVREDSVTSLQTFIDTFLKFFNALKALNVNVAHWDLFMVHHLSQKLDRQSRTEVEKKSPTDQILTIDEFIKILTNRCRFLNAISQDSGNTSSRTKLYSNRRQSSSISHAMVATSLKCSACLQSDHLIYKCDKFIAQTPEQRFNLVKKRQLCINCLGNNHVWQKCHSKYSCRECGKKHHLLLHRDIAKSSPNLSANAVSHDSIQISESVNVTDHESILQPPSQSNVTVSSLASTRLPCRPLTKSKKQILIGTAIIWVYDDANCRMPCRVILDSASHVHFVTEEFCKKLNVHRKSSNTSIIGIGETKSNPSQLVSLTVASRVTNFNVNLDFFVLPKITNELPLHSFDYDRQKLPFNLELADPYFNRPDKIDMLLGTEVYHEIVTGERLKIIEHLPPFLKTEFGLVLSGKVEAPINTKSECSFIVTLDEINVNIQRFWAIESIHSPSTFSIAEKECEKHYASHVQRKADGRYSVALPTKANVAELGDSRTSAKQQFLRLEQRMSRNQEMRSQYITFMREYISLNHMELHSNEPSDSEYYLPHHCVSRDSSETTKFRVVFNGSFKTTTKLSLNDVLQVGPTIQQNLFSILVRFRKHKFVFTADIVKMYRQVNIREDDRNLQKIWWRESPDHPLNTYRLRTVTYGTASAPFLAIRTLKQLALDEQHRFPTASDVLLTDFYVDDVLSGSDTIESTNTLRVELTQLLSLGCFELSKFASNYSQCNTVESNASSSSVILNNKEEISEKPKIILGIMWNNKDDQLVIKFGKLSKTPVFTKRIILSEITQIFDPLGLCSPVLFQAKCFIQRIWSNPEISWDDILPTNLQADWKKFRDELLQFNTITVPRCLIPTTKSNISTLHGFGDASEQGYGCCIYITCYDDQNNCKSSLVCSKSRVAPLRKLSIPRLELCASVLLAELMEKVISCMNINFDKVYFWTDSYVTLYRIKSNPSKYGTFVANRISLIQEMSHPDNWLYIPTTLNPADIVSRGLMPSEMQDNQLWWRGPNFLNDAGITWPIQPPKTSVLNDVEFRRSAVTLLQSSGINHPSDRLEILSRFGNFMTLLRTTALCYRFVSNCRNKKLGKNLAIDNLRPIEIEAAMIKLIKLIQQIEFKDEYQRLKKRQLVSKSSKLLQFAPFLDNDDVIRVGGRLHHSNISYEQKHQILLPDNSFSHLLARKEHLQNLHAGPQSLLNIIRKRFWLLNGRNICRKICHTCIRCYRTRPIIHQQVMGQLPAERVNPSRPFQTVGIDFCGPFNVIYKIRSKITTKVYIAIFTCFCTKACHMELVHNLTTEAFIASLRRFTGRRGLPSHIFTDNATNFVGAQAELKDLLRIFNSEQESHELIKFCADKGITWRTIPPRSPHFGGLWEAAVKSAKYHIKRALANERFTAEELETIVIETESILNSRPITPMSSNPNDLNALTPGHFLIGDQLTAPPNPNLLDLKFSTLSRWQRVQYIGQIFWKRFIKDYLNELQCRQKWHQPSKIVEGSMVILKDDNLPPMKWILGRITKTYTGPDGMVRVVDVRTGSGIFRRAVAKICILPIEDKKDD